MRNLTTLMSIADACLVRFTENLPNPLLLTTDSDFKIYRRLGRPDEASKLGVWSGKIMGRWRN